MRPDTDDVALRAEAASAILRRIRWNTGSPHDRPALLDYSRKRMRPTSDRTLSAQQFVDFDPNLSSTTSGTKAIAEQTAKSLIGLPEHCADRANHQRSN